MELFRIQAVNTAADSENRIHDDRVAREYGYRGGLVPGVTIYGYMASVAIEELGPDWLKYGAVDVRFFSPFFEGDEVEISASAGENGRLKLDAGTRASASAWMANGGSTDHPLYKPLAAGVDASRETILAGMTLGSFEKTLDLSEQSFAAPLDAFVGPHRLAHPAIVLALANEIFMRNFILGPWIHSSSEVRNFSALQDGDTIQGRGRIENAFEKKGHELAVLDIAILKGNAIASRIRHTVIWRPRKP